MATTQRFPPEIHGIEFHFCRTVNCPNYGLTPANLPQFARSTNQAGGYRLSGGKSSTPVFICNQCGGSVPLKSNAAIFEEFARMWAPFNDSSPSCPNLSCVALPSDAAISRLVMPHGTTKSGSPRYRCSKCLKTFTGQERVTRSSRRPGLDVELLNLLMNKMPMRRVCEVAKVNAAVLYNQIERSHSLAVKFASRHERKLIDEISLSRVYLAIDRQEYVFNWGSSLDRRNVVLRAIASSDNSSGYVFGMHLDFDGQMEAELTERQAILAGDYELPYHFRKFARIWLQQEHRDYRHTYKRLNSRKQTGSLAQEILQAYKDGLISSEEIEPR